MAGELLFIGSVMTRDSRERQGFTAVELLVVLAILSIVASLVLPNLMQMVHRSKIEGTCGRTAMLMQKARYEAIKRGVPTVVSIDPAANEVLAFADVHGAAATDPSDGLFNPIDGMVYRETDYELGRYRLPFGVSFTSPSDSGMDSVDGFVNDGDPDPPDKQAIYLPDGTILDTGAFRFADERGNFLEIRAAPIATAKLQIRKHDLSLPANGDGTHWYARREGGEPWHWF